MKNRIKELLGCGIDPVIVASAVGVSESYVSQLLADDDFVSEVQAMKLVNLTGLVERDKKWNTMEDKLLEKLENLLPMLANPMQVVSALRTVNGAQRRAVTKDPTAGPKTQVVHLHLPSVIAAKFIVNPTNQVIAIEGKALATMPANAVVRKLEELRQNSENHEAPAQLQDLGRATEIVESIRRIDHLPVAEVL